MIKIILVMLGLGCFPLGAYADCVSPGYELQWGSVATDYVMPFDGAKAYAGSPANETLTCLWNNQRGALSNDHPAQKVYGKFHHQIQSLLEASLPGAGNEMLASEEHMPPGIAHLKKNNSRNLKDKEKISIDGLDHIIIQNMSRLIFNQVPVD